MAKYLKKMDTVANNLKDAWYCNMAKFKAPSNHRPVGSKIKINDEVLIAENNYGIFGKGFVSKIKHTEFKSLTEFINYALHKSKIKDNDYWLKKIKTYSKEVQKNDILKLLEFKLENTKQFDIVYPLEKTHMFRSPWYILEDDFELKASKTNTILTKHIPTSIRQKVYHKFKIKATEHIIDIDHFVPKSLGGPGNIIENLIPISPSLNRKKSDHVPSKLFSVGKEKFNISLPKKFVENHDAFYSHPKDLKIAKKIIGKINERSFEEIKNIYLSIRNFHFPYLK